MCVCVCVTGRVATDSSEWSVASTECIGHAGADTPR
jgi:hypothetical protein